MFNLLGNVKADENVEMSARSHSLNNEVVVDIDETKANEEQASLTSFYDTVTEIKKLLASIKRNLADIQAENEKSKSTTKQFGIWSVAYWNCIKYSWISLSS
eukprot:jgi/Pico_ML_1/54345/g4707.t1